MFHNSRSRAATVASVCVLALGVGASSASAQPVVTGGLVNVTIVDAVDVNNNIVQVPIGVAANVCDVSVLQVLAGEVDATNCQAQNNQMPRAFRR